MSYMWTWNYYATLERNLCHMYPMGLQFDQGTSFIAQAAQEWGHSNGMQWTSHALRHLQPNGDTARCSSQLTQLKEGHQVSCCWVAPHLTRATQTLNTDSNAGGTCHCNTCWKIVWCRWKSARQPPD